MASFTTVPIQGERYKVKKGDELNLIAKTAYGDGTKWPIIDRANPTALKSGNPDIIFPGEIIIIPLLAERQIVPPTLSNKKADDLTLKINDIEIPGDQLVVTRTMDTASDGWKQFIAWTPGKDKKIDEATKPYGYQKSSVYIGNDLLINGYLYKVTPSGTVGGRSKTLQGFSFTKDAIDSTIKPPYEVNGYTLRQRALELINPLGIKVIWDLDDDLKFDKITASETDKIIPHLMKYAKQRGVLISSDEEGNLVFLKANTDGESIGTIEEGKSFGFLKYEAEFDGTKRFNTYKALGQTPSARSNNQIAKDDIVPNSRMMTFKAPDATAGDLKAAAEWQRSKALAEALTIPFEAEGFFGPDGKVWKENTLITVKSEVISVKEGFDFLISRVEYSKKSTGKPAVLSLVPPEVFTGEPIPDIFL